MEKREIQSKKTREKLQPLALHKYLVFSERSLKQQHVLRRHLIRKPKEMSKEIYVLKKLEKKKSNTFGKRDEKHSH